MQNEVAWTGAYKSLIHQQVESKLDYSIPNTSLSTFDCKGVTGEEDWSILYVCTREGEKARSRQGLQPFNDVRRILYIEFTELLVLINYQIHVLPQNCKNFKIGGGLD